jgi:hypothetical protein
MEERRNLFGILMARHMGKRPLGKPRKGWENDIKVDFRASTLNKILKTTIRNKMKAEQ